MYLIKDPTLLLNRKIDLHQEITARHSCAKKHMSNETRKQVNKEIV
jgi:hypothetical protein